jgi:hypothetical protein
LCLRAFSDCLRLFQTISNTFWLFQTFSDYFRLFRFQTFSDNFWLFWQFLTISDEFRLFLFQTISDHFRLFQIFSKYFRLFQTIFKNVVTFEIEIFGFWIENKKNSRSRSFEHFLLLFSHSIDKGLFRLRHILLILKLSQKSC